MIKIAQLANELDKKGFFEEANDLDHIMSDIILFNKKFSKVYPENIKTYQENNLELKKISKKLEATLEKIDSKESNKILEELKIAGIQDFIGGLGEALKTPFSSIGNFFKNLSQGGKLKKAINNSLKNLSNIRDLIASREEDKVQTAQQLLIKDIDSLLSILKEAYGDMTFFDESIKNNEGQQNQQNTIDQSFENDQSYELNDNEAIKEILQNSSQTTANSKKLFTKYAQNQGALALINDLAQLRYTAQNDKELQSAFNAWVAVLSSLNRIQYDRPAEPQYTSMNPDINDPSRGGGFDPSGQGSKLRPNKPITDVKKIPQTFTEKESLKKLTNSTTFKGAVKNFMRLFGDRKYSQFEVEDLVEAARREWNPDKYWKDSPFQAVLENTLSGWYRKNENNNF